MYIMHTDYSHFFYPLSFLYYSYLPSPSSCAQVHVHVHVLRPIKINEDHLCDHDLELCTGNGGIGQKLLDNWRWWCTFFQNMSVTNNSSIRGREGYYSFLSPLFPLHIPSNLFLCVIAVWKRKFYWSIVFYFV